MFAEVNGVNIHYEESGEGVPIVLIGGFGANYRFWKDTVSLMKGCRCITLDNRGVGDTEYDGEFSMDDMADDIVALMEHLGIERFHAIGWSMGSQILQSMSRRHPERLFSQVLMSTYMYPPARSGYILGEFIRMVSEGKASMESFCVVVNAFCFSEGVFKMFEENGTIMSIPKNPATVEGLRDQLTAVFNFHPAEFLHEISVPTLVVQGKEDIMTPFKDGQQVAEEIPGAELFAVEGAGHTMDPRQYMGKALEFIERHSPE